MNLDENLFYKRVVMRLKKEMPTTAPSGPVAWSSVTGKPSTFPAAWSDVTGKPTYSPVATSGAYSDLSGRPTLFGGAYADLTGLPSLFAGTWAALTGKPTTLAGFGITDAVTGAALTSALGNYTTMAALTALLTAKADSSAVKRIDTYSGTTDANGLVTITYTSAFPAVPSVQPEPPTASNQVWVKVTSTTTGCSLRLVQRAAVTVLGLEVLLAGTTNVAGAPARVVVVAA